MSCPFYRFCFIIRMSAPMADRKSRDAETATAVSEGPVAYRLEAERASLAAHSWWYRFGVNSWTQIVLVSFACFCLPGMYNAITGMGGSGQLDPTVSNEF